MECILFLDTERIWGFVGFWEVIRTGVIEEGNPSSLVFNEFKNISGKFSCFACMWL